MADRIRFGAGRETGIFAELEDLRAKGEVDKLITRALEPDSNLLLMHEVLACVENGPLSPKAHKRLLKELAPALQRAVAFPKKRKTRIGDSRTDRHIEVAFPGQPEAAISGAPEELPPEVEGILDRSRSLGPFLLEEDVLPGNGKAESLCASPDGSMLAYTTWAAVPLQEDGRRRIRSAPAEALSSSSARSPSVPPKMVNIISFDPYDAWSFRVGIIQPELETTNFELVGLDHDHLYALNSTGIHKWLLDVDIHDGTLRGSYDLCDHCGAFFLDVEGRRVTFIDTVSEVVSILNLSDAALLSYPLSLPSGLNAKDLNAVEFNPNGTTGVVLVAPRSDSSGVLLAIIRISQGQESTIRWFKRKEMWIDKGFEKGRFSLRGLPRDSASEVGAFYLVDATNTIYTLPLSILTNKKLDEIDPAHLLSPIPASKGGKKALFPVMAVGAERPLLVTYDMAAGQLRVWDTSTDSHLVTIPCPVHLERMDLVAHDTLLITKSRSTRRTWDDLAVTFLDFFFLAGQAPTSLGNDCIPLLEPLAAWAPGNQLIDFMRRLILLAGEYTKEASA